MERYNVSIVSVLSSVYKVTDKTGKDNVPLVLKDVECLDTISATDAL